MAMAECGGTFHALAYNMPTYIPLVKPNIPSLKGIPTKSHGKCWNTERGENLEIHNTDYYR